MHILSRCVCYFSNDYRTPHQKDYRNTYMLDFRMCIPLHATLQRLLHTTKEKSHLKTTLHVFTVTNSIAFPIQKTSYETTSQT